MRLHVSESKHSYLTVTYISWFIDFIILRFSNYKGKAERFSNYKGKADDIWPKITPR